MAVWLNQLGIVSALGVGREETRKALTAEHRTTPLTRTTALGFAEQAFYVGQVPSLALSEPLRNNRLADMALAQLADCLAVFCDTPRERVGVVIGTSTADIADGERARQRLAGQGTWPQGFHYSAQELTAPASYIAEQVEARGPVFSISTACSSGAKALLSAKALLEADVVDMVVCGGVDSLCKMTVNGFLALASTSAAICRPFSAHRDGINLGEGAGLFVMSRRKLDGFDNIRLYGGGESSDAYHISAPEPSGQGASAAMATALQNAGLSAADIDYINAHGTATPKNDEMEASAIGRLFSCGVPVSSTKHLTGHTLGAAGAVEAGICWLLSQSTEPQCLPWQSDCEPDPALAEIDLLTAPRTVLVDVCLSNSFAFGGNNVCLILGKDNDSL